MPHALPGVLTRSRSICFATNELSSPFFYFMYFFRDLAALLKMFSDFLTVGSTTPQSINKGEIAHELVRIPPTATARTLLFDAASRLARTLLSPSRFQ